jgi:hypothetical protein
MLDSAVQMLIGAAATVGYLSLWNQILQSTAASRADGDPDVERRLRQRRRLAQLVLFVLLTPYVLTVFRLMDGVHFWLTQVPVV